ncbi:MAG TPA: DUF4136 domain-containing protein [Steroidobacteraceae bacterium]|nr:DUF4136 domain-containing protein [Steroidobacteraceae bacterium]
MTNRILIASMAATLLALTGCATQSSAVRVVKGDADLAKCRTFDWHSASADAASFTEQRVKAAALKQLEAKGYTLSTDKPDCRIAYLLPTQETPKRKPTVGVGVGGGSGGVRGGIGVGVPIGSHKEQIGTLTLDIVDVTQNAQIWSGSMEVGLHGLEISEEEANEAVGLILAEFPDRASK